MARVGLAFDRIKRIDDGDEFLDSLPREPGLGEVMPSGRSCRTAAHSAELRRLPPSKSGRQSIGKRFAPVASLNG